jgi:hypothetical protein
MPDCWTPAEDRLLRELAGTLPMPVLAARLERDTGYPRTEAAIRIRCKRLGISAYARCMTMREVEHVFGTSHRTVRMHWIATGLLVARRWGGRGPNEGWWIERTDVEAFIRAYPWAYDWTAMREGHPLTKLAETVNRADPWLDYATVAAYLGLAKGNLDKWVRRGLVPHRRRAGAGGHGQILVRRSDLPNVAAAIAEARERNAREGLRRSVETRRAKAARRDLEAAS